MSGPTPLRAVGDARGGDAARAGAGSADDTATRPWLSLRGIHKHFGAVQALAGVDLDVYLGEVLALVGDNGAGKSTLVKIIAGAQPPVSGGIYVAGDKRVFDTPQDSRRSGIECVFQDLALCDNLTVAANIFLGREMGPWGRLDEVAMHSYAAQLLHGLSERVPATSARVSGLSGGQRQIVAIARALLTEPRLVILDEPTAALGVAQTAEVLNLVERLRSQGLAVLMISHNMEDVLSVADRIAVLRLGANAGTFDARSVTAGDLVRAITGATDNAAARRSHLRHGTASSGLRPDPVQRLDFGGAVDDD